jgi:sarcosine oxidase delta subunit
MKPSVTDWDAFYKFIHENKYFHLLERRPHTAGCRELFQMRGAIPGVVPFVKRVVRVTKLS